MAMTSQEMTELCLRHTMYSWSANGRVSPLPVARAAGVYLYGPEDQRWLDFNSQLMCVNIGHNHPKVIEAIKRATEGVLFAYPGSATEPRARLGQRLAQLVPGDINTFFFTLGGAEANENAIKAVRQFTGRHKILSRYRSYHGGTHACMQLTGDPRRLPHEPGAPGFVKVLDPRPRDYRFGDDDEQIVDNHMRYLEEVLTYEGPQTIAAMFIETVTGSNGILPPPRGYLPRLRELLDQHGILLVCDEVMAGFGRTGKMFAFEHYGITPDVVTMAKGLSSAYVPLGAMGVSDAIAEHFRENVFWGGLTYNAHPFACAVALATLDVMTDEGMVDNAARMGVVMREEMDRLTAAHPSVGEGRCIGLFGMLEIHRDAEGNRLAPYGGTHPAMQRVDKWLREHGMFTFVRWSGIMCNPPLCITEEQLREGFALIDQALAITDEAFEG